MKRKIMQTCDEDVPSPINLKDLKEAKHWADESNIKRPWRYAFFQYYSQHIQQSQALQILEIGSGPGFLASFLLAQHLDIQYTAVDFSEAMHELSQQSLDEGEKQRIQYIISDFKQNDWTQDLEANFYDVIIIHQALHELRHKKHAKYFHQTVKKLLKPQGTYFICDHIYANDAMQNNQLYMSPSEHIAALQQADFIHIKRPLVFKGLCLFECT